MMLISENHIKIYQALSSFYFKKKLNLIKKGLLMKNLEIQVIIHIYIIYAQSFFGKDL